MADRRVDVAAVRARRRREQEALLDRARRFATSLPGHLDVRGVVVVGSVARGDFNLWSDVDVLVVAGRMEGGPLGRLEALGPAPGGVQPVAWTPAEWHQQLERRNPLAVEAVETGIWLLGSPADLSPSRQTE